jgi:hypothetical protein
VFKRIFIGLCLMNASSAASALDVIVGPSGVTGAPYSNTSVVFELPPNTRKRSNERSLPAGWGMICGVSSGLTEAQDFDARLFGEGDAENVVVDKNDIGYRMFIGISLWQYLSFEFAYSNLGHAEFTGKAGTLHAPRPLAGEIGVTGLDFMLTGRWPVTQTTFVGLRLGPFQWEMTEDFLDTSPYFGQSRRYHNEDEGIDFFYGATVAQAFGEHVEVFLDFLEYPLKPAQDEAGFHIEEYDIRTLSLGLRVRFGAGSDPGSDPP